MAGEHVTRAVILVGGAGRRMGGVDKPLLPLAGHPMLAHIVKALTPQCKHLALATGVNAEPYRAFGLPVLPDQQSGAGPLTGLVSALDWAKADADTLALVAGDTPFLPFDLIARLVTGRSDKSRAIFAASKGRVHYSIGLWPLAAADRIAAYNKTADDRSLAAVARLIGYDQIEWTEEPDPFFNINSPEDWALAEDRLRTSHAL